MGILVKGIQLLGMALTGVGLIYGIAENDMTHEFLFLGFGILVFLIGIALGRR